MYRVKLKGNYNICVNDLNAIFTHNRPEKTFTDNEFENSEDIQKFIGKFLDVEHVDIKQPKGGTTKLENTVPKTKTPEIKTKVENNDDRKTIIIENKEVKSNIIQADNASSTLPKQSENDKTQDIVIADGVSKEKNNISEEDKKSVRMDNFGNVVQTIDTKEQPVKETENTTKTKKKNKVVKKSDGVEKTNE